MEKVLLPMVVLPFGIVLAGRTYYHREPTYFKTKCYAKRTFTMRSCSAKVHQTPSEIIIHLLLSQLCSASEIFVTGNLR